jgi:hypothetical protein
MGSRIAAVLAALAVLSAVGLSIAVAVTKPGQALPNWGLVFKALAVDATIVTGAWVIGAILVALVQAWGEQSHRLRVAEDDLTDEREAKRPTLVARLERLTVQIGDAKPIPKPKPYILATVAVFNEGHRSRATNWEMFMGDRCIREVHLGPWRWVEEIFDVDWSTSPPEAKKVVAYDDDMGIGNVTAESIDSGERPTGFFLAQIIEDSVTLDALQSIRLRCEDFMGNPVFTGPPQEIQLGDIKRGDKNPGVFPPYGFKRMPADIDRRKL